MPRRNSLPRNVMFGLASWLGPLAFTFALTPTIVHGVGLEAYGVYALVMGFVGYSMTFNVGRAMTKHVAAYHATEQSDRIGEVLSHALVINVLVGLAGGSALAVATPVLVTRVLALAPGLHATATLALYLASVGLLLTTLSQLFAAVPQALHRLDAVALVTTIVAMLTLGGNAILVSLGHGAPAMVAWNTAVAGLSCVCYFAALRRLLPNARLGFVLRKDLLASILRFTGAVTAYQVLGSLLLLFERVWLTRALGPAAVTAYVVPMTIALYIHAFIASLTLALFPLASEADARQDHARLHQLYTRTFKYVAMLVVFMTVTMALGSDRILTNWMGPDFAAGSSRVLALQAIAVGLIAIAIIPWQMSDGLGRPSRNTWLVGSWLLIGVPIMVWLTPQYGAVGMAYGRLASTLTIPAYVLMTERTVFGRCLWEFWRPTACWLIVVGVAVGSMQWWLFRTLPGGWLSLIGVIGLTGGLCVVALWVGGYLDQGERAWLRRAFARNGS